MTKGYRIWQVVYPVGIYYVVSSLVYFILEQTVGTEDETYMLRQLICSAAAIPFMYSFYRQDGAVKENVFGKREKPSSYREFAYLFLRTALLPAASCAALGIAVNNMIAMTPLMEYSEEFKTVNQMFFGGQAVFELLGACLIVPVAEELLFRGVVYLRLRMYFGTAVGLFGSAVIFGLIHFNAVQFLYACILGILLAFFVEETGYVSAAVFGHIAANAAAVLRRETGWLSFSYEPTAKGIAFTAVMLLIAAGLICCFVYMSREHTGSENRQK